MNKDLSKVYNEILIKHLDFRDLNEDKVNSCMKNILVEAKEYFIQKYPDYDLILYNYICPIYFSLISNFSSFSIVNSKINKINFVSFKTDSLYSILYFFFYKHSNINYELDFEKEIIGKGNEILRKYLEGRKYNNNKLFNYNKSINDEYIDFILKRQNNLMCFYLNGIYKNPIESKFFFKYMIYGRDTYSKIFHNYVNDALTSYGVLFFLK